MAALVDVCGWKADAWLARRVTGGPIKSCSPGISDREIVVSFCHRVHVVGENAGHDICNRFDDIAVSQTCFTRHGQIGIGDKTAVSGTAASFGI